MEGGRGFANVVLTSRPLFVRLKMIALFPTLPDFDSFVKSAERCFCQKSRIKACWRFALYWAGGGTADAGDLKSSGVTPVRVRLPPGPFQEKRVFLLSCLSLVVDARC